MLRVADSVAMYRTLRSCRLPPHTLRLPRNVPLSRLKGATQRRDLLAVQIAQLKQPGNDGGTQHRSHAGNATQQLGALPPLRAGIKQFADVPLHLPQLRIQV